MNYRLLLKIVGLGLVACAAFMLVPLIISLVNDDGVSLGILYSLIITAAAGILLTIIKNDKEMRARDGVVGVVFCWIAISFMGALPFYLTGAIPNLADCFFEAASGFSTTGATILTDIEALPLSLLMWRSLMHWLGGMGVIVFLLILPSKWNAKSVHLLNVESTGPVKGKMLPSASKTAKMLYLIYAGFTFAEVIALIIAGMPVFDSFLHAFSTAGTGGYSMMNASIAAYDSVAIDVIITIFMFLFGISFTLHYQLLRGGFKEAFKSTEFKVYLITIGAIMVIIAFNIASLYGYNMADAFRYASFQVVSVSSTTGFITADFNTWPMLSQTLLVILMFFGGMAGSTGGGMKFSRIVIAAKSVRRSLKQALHPNLVKVIKTDGRAVPETTVMRVALFFVAYFGVMAIAMILISFDNFDFTTTFTAVISAMSNVGPGLSLVGPVGNFSIFSDFSKVVLSFCMIIGRLEVLPFLIIFARRTWRV